MKLNEKHIFNLLKSAIAETFLQNNSAPEAISEWKGEEILQFQEDLFDKVKAKVSEKWFYTYIKNEPEKLPRIDMLNLLSNYVGFDNWNAFRTVHQKRKLTRKGSLSKVFLAVLFVAICFFLMQLTSKNEFHFCFVDQDKGDPIKNIPLDIKIFQENQSPLFFKTDSLGCFTYTTKLDKVHFVVQSPFHKTDTILRYIGSNNNQTVILTTDDYALMLDYYTNGNIKDWKKRKVQLEKMIADQAVIYQLFKNNLGVEIYSKDEFIRKLTIPTQNLKRFKILDKSFKDEQIVKLKFIIE